MLAGRVAQAGVGGGAIWSGLVVLVWTAVGALTSCTAALPAAVRRGPALSGSLRSHWNSTAVNRHPLRHAEREEPSR